MTINFLSGNIRYPLVKFQKPKTFDPETGHGAFLWAMFLLYASRPSKRDAEPDGSYFIGEINGARLQHQRMERETAYSICKGIRH